MECFVDFSGLIWVTSVNCILGWRRSSRRDLMKSRGTSSALYSDVTWEHCVSNRRELDCWIKGHFIGLLWGKTTCDRWISFTKGQQRRKRFHGPLTRYVKLQVAHAPGMPGTFPRTSRVSDPDMHHCTCVMHVPCCMPGSLTSGVLWSRCRGKRSRHSRRMRNPQFYVSGKRPMSRHPQRALSW